MHVTGLPADQAGAEFEVVVAFVPADRAVVLEGVVDILQRNVRTIADIAEGSECKRRQRVSEGTEGGHARREADVGLINTLAVVERQGKVVDTGEPGPEVEQYGGGKDVGVTQDVLLSHVRLRDRRSYTGRR